NKIENGKPGSVGAESQKLSPQSTTPQHPSSGGTTPATIMSQHGMMTSLEPPFMQQQNKVFVFSTRLANEAAESVRHGHCKSIIQYHMDHPNTKAFLQKNPLKASSFRHGMLPAVMSSMKAGQQAPGMIRMPGPGPSPPGWGPQHPSAMEGMMGPEGMMLNGPYHPGGPGPRMMGSWPGQGCSGLHPHPHGPMGPGGYPLGSMMDMESEMMMMGGPHNSNISSSQIPDENLTLEQRQHRSRGLAQLTKIHKMLMGGSNPGDGQQPPHGHEPGMYHGGPGGMTSHQQQAMMSQHAMMTQAGMMPPHGMMSPQHQHMMAQQMSSYGPRGPPGMVPPGMNGKEQPYMPYTPEGVEKGPLLYLLTYIYMFIVILLLFSLFVTWQFQDQHAWYQMQREFYMEKQHRMQHMVSMRGPHMDPVPPPSYYSSVSQKHSGMSSPPSPGMNGMRMPMPPHGLMGSGMDPDGMGMFGGPPDMCRPPHMGMEPMPGMHPYPPHMPPQGPMDPGFDPMMVGGIPPGMGPGPPDMVPRHHGPMRQSHMMGSNGVMPSMKGPNQVTLHRAGNPEQFNPETMGGVVPPLQTQSGSSNSSKPPPSYAQAQKRKRGSDMDDSYTKGNLQQTPSPTKIHYHLSQFEGQELTITKQLNTAYVANDGGDDSGAASSAGSSSSSNGGMSGGSAGLFNSHASSPLHGPGSNKGPHSNSSQTSVHMVSSPAVSTTGPSPHQGPATPHSTTHSSSVPSSGANMRLSHFDPVPLSNGIGSGPHTPTPKPSSMSNITSASLANLAKGVENLSNQMQQNMMQGGPFHSIQVQGQMTSSNSNSNNSSNNSSSVSSTAATTTTASLSPSTNSASHPVTTAGSQASGSPNVNNAYMATNMSASQVNMPLHPSVNNYVNMQMQNMNSESTNMNLQPCSMQHGMSPHMGPGMIGGGPRSGMPHHMPQGPMMTPVGPNGPSPVMGQGLPMLSGHMPPGLAPGGSMPPHRPSSSSGMPATPPTLSKSHFTSPPLSHPSMGGLVPLPDVTSPSFPVTSSSNSSVQIQQKGHNTIQYLPANPPSSMPTYFPSSSPTPSRPPHMSSALSAAAAMGPEFANQATIAMHQSASMMRSSSIPDLHAMQGSLSGMPPSSMGPMGPSPGMPPSSMGPLGPSMMMGGPEPMMGMGHMRPGHSPGALHPSLGPGSLECVSPIPGMGGYMSNGPSIEQAQAQAQAHAAMMMQGNSQMSVSSPHGPMPPCGGPSPHMNMPPCGGPSPHSAPMMGMPGGSLHGPMPPGGMPGSSIHGPPMPGQSPHGHPMSGQSPHGHSMPVQSPHGSMPCSIPGSSPHGPMPGTIPGPSLHGPMPGPPTHSSMMGPMIPHGHMGHMHGPGMPSGGMPRQPGMGAMRMVRPSMGSMSGQYGMQYPGYQQEYYPSLSPRGHPRQMMPGMMGGPVQPYGMMP
ncbi:unnamed protein product, partial [Candidula unifasciata]